MSSIDGHPTEAEVAEWESLRFYATFRAQKAADALRDTIRLNRLQLQLDMMADASDYTSSKRTRERLSATVAEFVDVLESLSEAVMMHEAYWDRMAGEHRFRTAGDVFRHIAEREVRNDRNA